MTRISGAIGGVSDSALARRGLSFGRPLARPAGFTYPRALFPFDFWRDAGGRVRTSFDRRAWAPTPDVTPWAAPVQLFADITRSDDGGDGLGWATAKKSISAAIAAGNAGTAPFVVNVRAGTYPRANAAGVTPNKACALLAVGGRVETGWFDPMAWTPDAGTTWKAAHADVRRVIDLAGVDEDGLRQDLTWAGSLAAARATPGTWWTDNATVYVTRADGAAVTDANTRALLTTGNAAVLRMSSGGNMFVSGFDVMGSLPCIVQNAAGFRFVAEDCTFRYSSGDDGIVVAGTTAPRHGVTVLDAGGAAFIRCDASANQADGFNSHRNANGQAFVFTMDCTGFRNGRPGSTSNNFITTHDGGRWIDLRGVGARNAGANVAVDSNDTMMWCIDTLAYASLGDRALGGLLDPVDFQANSGTATLFIDGGASGGSAYGLYAANGTILTRSGRHQAPALRGATGTVGGY